MDKKGFAYLNACVSYLAVFLKSFEILCSCLKSSSLSESLKIACLNSIHQKKYARSIKKFFSLYTNRFSFSPIYKVTRFWVGVSSYPLIGLFVLIILGALDSSDHS
jgi:hypothetical protein